MRLRVMLAQAEANTVAVHRNHIMKKIGVRKATALALFAAERGLVARK